MSLALISQSYLSDSDLDGEINGGVDDDVLQNNEWKPFPPPASGAGTDRDELQNLEPVGLKVEAGLSDIENSNDVDEDMLSRDNCNDTKIDKPTTPMSSSRSKRSRPTLFRERNVYKHKSLPEVKYDPLEKKVEGAAGTGSENKIVQFYKCPCCLLVCPTGNDLIQHLGIHMEYRDKADAKTITKKTIRTNKGKRGLQRQNQSMGSEKLEKKFKCDQCFATFKFAIQRIRHMIYHDTSRPWKCSQCDYYFSTQGRLANHERRVHDIQTQIKLELPEKNNRRPKNRFESAAANHVKKVKHIPSYQVGAEVVDSDMSVATIDPHKTPNADSKKITGGRKRNGLFPGASSRSRLISRRKRIPCMPAMRFKCQKCDSAFPRAHQLACHMRMHDETRPLKCSHCNYYFLTAGRLLLHETRIHIKDGGTKGIPQAIPNTSSSGDPAKTGNLTGWTEIHPFQLRPCKVVLARCDNLLANKTTTDSNEHGNDETLRRRRRKLQVGAAARKISLMSQSGGMKREWEDTSPNPYSKTGSLNPDISKKKFPGFRKSKSRSCPVCPKVFRNHDQARIHLRIHTKEKPYQCPTCPKAFSQPGTLTVHIRTHTGEKPFECSTCTKKYACKSNLQKHVSIHTGVWKYKCHICFKGFAQKLYLEYHLYSHTGEKPFTCPHCSRGFRQPQLLKYHVKNNHN